MRLHELPLWFGRTFAVTFGLLWGSFLNVVIYRLPREMSVVSPGSRCPGCGTPIRAYDNIPVVSFLVLGGKARCCGAKMSPRYPMVELLGGVLSLAVWEFLVRTLPASATWTDGAVVYFSGLTLVLGLLAAAFIDAEHMYLPDGITLGGAVLGLATASFRGLSYVDSLLGAAVGFAIVWLPFMVLYKRVRGRTGMGMGDAKLMALAGAWFGWAPTLFVLFGGAIQASLFAIALFLVRGKIDEPESVRADREELERAAAEGDEEARELLEDDPLGEAPGGGLGQQRLPFGPFLILAIFEYLFAGDVILEWILPTV